MSTRLGIELSPAACRLVEVEGRLRPDAADTPRVRSFAVLPPAGPETEAMLASLKGRRAAVVVWGPPSEHRQVVVTDGSYEGMRREAVGALSSLGLKTTTALADIAPVPGADKPKRRPVVVALAAADPMLEAIRPIHAAGIRVRTLVTPAMALGSMARMRRGFSPPGAIEAYIAVEEMTSCIALMRDGALAIARELSWGYVEDARGALRARDEIASRLAGELEQYLDAVGAPAAAQVCICGGVPDLRTMSAALTAQLDVEVEPLDSLFGIDATRLPEPSDEFRDRIAELRLAWAVAADWPAHMNLLRARRRERSRRLFAAAAVAAGVTAGIGGALQIASSQWWGRTAARPAAARRTPPPQTARATPPSPRVLTPAPRSSPAAPAGRAPASNATPPAVAARSAPPPPAPLATRSVVPRAAQVAQLQRAPEPALTPALRQAAIATATVAPPPAPSAAPPARPAAPPPQIARPAAPQIARPVAPPPRITRGATAPPAPTESSSAPPPRPAPAPVVPQRPQAQPQRSVAPPPPRASKPEPVLPFDASLETILYSADRKLAIIDGRIVGVGDTVRGARIVEIAPTAVLFRDAQGKLRRLTLGERGK